MAVTRFWRLSQRWLPSCTICFSLLAVSVRFSRASRRYCLLMSSSCVSLSWICRWKACGRGGPCQCHSCRAPGHPFQAPDHLPQVSIQRNGHRGLASPVLLTLVKNSFKFTARGWHKSVMSHKAAGAADGRLGTGRPGPEVGKPATYGKSFKPAPSLPHPRSSGPLGWGGPLPRTSSALLWQRCTAPRRNSGRPLSSRRT